MKSIIVIGGGFFGLYLAEYFSKLGHNVQLLEKESEFMSRASYNNQARVHNGYHYPRSTLTALRSRLSFPVFAKEFNECIVSDFEKYYMIGSSLSKVSANQFQHFCSRIGAKCDPAPARINGLVNPALIDKCYSVVEYAFDAIKLRDLMLERISAVNVGYRLKVSAESIVRKGEELVLTAYDHEKKEQFEISADHVFNCTYSRINYLLSNSNIELIPFKHEMTEMCLVDMPDELKNTGITLMCGPFFSVMPFPSVGLHSFSHVRYTPHYEWYEGDMNKYFDSHKKAERDIKNTAWNYMKKDAARYIPLLNECEYKTSLWEIKTLLPRSEVDDSRPILFKPNHGLSGFHCIMGGKIDNVYDVIDTVNSMKIIT